MWPAGHTMLDPHGIFVISTIWCWYVDSMLCAQETIVPLLNHLFYVKSYDCQLQSRMELVLCITLYVFIIYIYIRVIVMGNVFLTLWSSFMEVSLYMWARIRLLLWGYTSMRVVTQQFTMYGFACSVVYAIRIYYALCIRL
jgi:hypothetical protein